MMVFAGTLVDAEGVPGLDIARNHLGMRYH